MASDLKIVAGAAMRQTRLRICTIQCACGSDSQVVPSCFHRNATASRRSTSAPWLARKSISWAMSASTRGLVQFRSHWKSWNVVHTQRGSSAATGVKEPGWSSGKISRVVRSKASGISRSG